MFTPTPHWEQLSHLHHTVNNFHTYITLWTTSTLHHSVNNFHPYIILWTTFTPTSHCEQLLPLHQTEQVPSLHHTLNNFHPYITLWTTFTLHHTLNNFHPTSHCEQLPSLHHTLSNFYPYITLWITFTLYHTVNSFHPYITLWTTFIPTSHSEQLLPLYHTVNNFHPRSHCEQLPPLHHTVNNFHPHITLWRCATFRSRLLMAASSVVWMMLKEGAALLGYPSGKEHSMMTFWPPPTPVTQQVRLTASICEENKVAGTEGKDKLSSTWISPFNPKTFTTTAHTRQAAFCLLPLPVTHIKMGKERLILSRKII